MSYSLIRGIMFRGTKLDGCGNPLLGPRSVVATDGVISVALTANNDEGETITVTNAAGNKCVNEEPTPKFLNWSFVISFCGVHPELFNLLSNQPLVLNAAGTEAVGFRVNSKVDVDAAGFAWEMWSRVPLDACGDSGETPYGYMLVPFSKGGTIGDLTVENGAVNFTVTGAKSKDGSGWGVGPFNVTRDEANAPGPLNEPITSGDHMHTELVTVAPPEDSDGAIALGVAATGANSSTTPATLSPGNSYPPVDLADAQTGFTATPTTAWAAGKYVRLGDGSTAHWNGTAWVAGVA